MSWKDLVSKLLGKSSAPELVASPPIAEEVKTDTSDSRNLETAESPLQVQSEPEISGHLTQYSGVDENAQKSLLVIGLDFGTAFTKVVVGGVTGKWAVPFDSLINEGNRFLLPGVLGVDDSGVCFVGNKEECTNSITDLNDAPDFKVISLKNIACMLRPILPRF